MHVKLDSEVWSETPVESPDYVGLVYMWLTSSPAWLSPEELAVRVLHRGVPRVPDDGEAAHAVRHGLQHLPIANHDTQSQDTTTVNDETQELRSHQLNVRPRVQYERRLQRATRRGWVPLTCMRIEHGGNACKFVQVITSVHVALPA